MDKEIQKHINEAVRESDTAANEFGNLTNADDPQRAAFERQLGAGQVALMRAQIEIVRALCLLQERGKQ